MLGDMSGFWTYLIEGWPAEASATFSHLYSLDLEAGLLWPLECSFGAKQA